MKFGLLTIVISLILVTGCTSNQPSTPEIVHLPSTPVLTSAPTPTPPPPPNTPVPQPEQPTLTPTLTAPPPPPPIDTPTPVQNSSTPNCRVNANLLKLCTAASPYENLLVKGVTFSPLARNPEGDRLQIQIPNTDYTGWIPADSPLIECANLDVVALPVAAALPNTTCSPTPTTAIGVAVSLTAAQPGSKNITLQIERADEGHTFFISLLHLAITDNNGQRYDFDCDIVNNCAWSQLSAEMLPYQIEGILKQPIDPTTTQVTLSLQIDRGETGIPYVLTWQQSLLPPEERTVAPLNYPPPHIDSFTVTPTRALTIGHTISLAWQAQGDKAEICYISGAPVECQEAPLAGSWAITVDETMMGYAIGQIGLRVTASDTFTWSLVTLDFQCRYKWFFEAVSAGCPEAPPIYSRGAAQYFERGLMIWSEQPDRFYVFFDEDHQFTWFDADWVKESNFLATPEPLPTPTGVVPTPAPWPIAPPPNMFEPVGGFGRVWQHFWRYDEHGLPVTVRQDIGWATGPEFEFEAAYQCALGTAAYGQWGCSLRSPTGTVLGFAPQSTVRDRWIWGER